MIDKRIIFPILAILGISPVMAAYGMMGYGGGYGMGLGVLGGILGLVFLIIAAFIFSAVFWWTYNWLVHKEKGK